MNARMSMRLPAIFTLTLALGCGVELEAGTVRIDYSSERQTIEGFGASDAWSIDPTLNGWMRLGHEQEIERLADLLFSVDGGIGLSGWRFNIGAGSAEQGEASRIPDPMRRAQLLMPAPGAAIDRGKQRGQIRMLRAAHERGVGQLVAFANSPPHWATRNGLAHPGDGRGVGSTNLDPARLDDFVEFLVTVVAYLRTEVGVPINVLSPINEPTWDWEGQSQEANRYNMAEAAAVYLRTRAALDRAGLGERVEVDGAEVVEYLAALGDAFKLRFDGELYTGGMNGKGHGSYKNYVDELLGDPALRRALGNKISLHAYWSDASEDRMGTLRDLLAENVRKVSPSARIWISEFCILGDAGELRPFDGHGFDVANIDYPLHVARVVHRDLTRLDATAWFWWLALTPYDYKDGLLKIDPSLEASSLQASKLLWTFGHFSRFVRPGYRRVELDGADDLHGVMASAYKAPDDERLVIVAINAGSRPARVSLAIDGLPAGTAIDDAEMFVTDRTRDLASVGVTPVTAVELPARSITTLVASLRPQTAEM